MEINRHPRSVKETVSKPIPHRNARKRGIGKTLLTSQLVSGVYLLENPKLYERPQLVEEDEEIMIYEEIGHGLRIDTCLNYKTKEKLINLLREYKDITCLLCLRHAGARP